MVNAVAYIVSQQDEYGVGRTARIRNAIISVVL